MKDAVTKPVPCSANPRWGQWLTFDDLLFSNVPRVRVHHHSTRPLFARVSFRANRVCVCGRVMLSFFRNRAFAAPSMRKRPERRTQFRLLGPTSTSSSTRLHASPHFCYIAEYAKHTCVPTSATSTNYGPACTPSPCGRTVHTHHACVACSHNFSLFTSKLSEQIRMRHFRTGQPDRHMRG